MIQRIKNKIVNLRADPHMREVARGTLLAFILKLSGSGLAFAFNVAVARLLGAEGAGLYFLALAVTTIGSVIGRVGLDNSLLRFVATRATHGDWSGVRGVYAMGMYMAVAASVVITPIVFFAAPWMASSLFKKPELSEPLRWMSLSILPFAILNLQAESLKGLKRIRDAMVVQGIGVPLVGLLLIVPLAYSYGVIGVSVAYSAGTVVVAVLGVWVWHRTMSEHMVRATPFLFRELWSSCKPLILVLIVHRAILPWAPLFLLGIWASSEEVAIFGAASRVAMLVSFMLTTLNNVSAPKFAELYAKKDMRALGQTARRTAMLITILASPIFLVLIFGGHWVMMMFGSEYAQGALVLVILSIGQFVNALTGSVGYLLMMSGNESKLQNLTLWTTLLMLAAAVGLIPHWGGIGAALAVTLAVILSNIWSVIVIKSQLGIAPVPNWLNMSGIFHSDV